MGFRGSGSLMCPSSTSLIQTLHLGVSGGTKRGGSGEHGVHRSTRLERRKARTRPKPRVQQFWKRQPWEAHVHSPSASTQLTTVRFQPNRCLGRMLPDQRQRCRIPPEAASQAPGLSQLARGGRAAAVPIGRWQIRAGKSDPSHLPTTWSLPSASRTLFPRLLT